ncbi:Cysteine desulfuration protein SufE [Ekhidna lutea]|uniref:Cysteine desulfuration protein SufE n=1 Tax=Ekhidna lutea TaxID=447679 RepID=A0A239LZF1_EKHLU|nr:SufE family protein [Ekhidna lutea]SNT35896.1 Cysteine desulfuration protein SufE [Ekhidna lutea]
MDQIKQRQEEIIEEFSMLDGDMEMTLDYIMELGAELGPFPDESRIEDNIVKGCQSKVWMLAGLDNDRVQFKADSNTAITKGLVSLLVRVLNQSAPQDVMNAEIYFPKQIGMDRFIGTQRSNGFAAMIKQMKMYALALTAKQES